MAIRLLEYLDPEEAAALADFLVEVVGVEREVDRALAVYYALPGRRAQFLEQFVDRSTLGNKLQRLRPALEDWGASERLRDRLKELVEVRNAVAHGEPRSEYADAADPEWEEPRRVYKRGERTVAALDLETYASMATSVRVELGQLIRPD